MNRSDKDNNASSSPGSSTFWVGAPFDLSVEARQMRNWLRALVAQGHGPSLVSLGKAGYLWDCSEQERLYWESLDGPVDGRQALVCHSAPILPNGANMFGYCRFQYPGFATYVGLTTCETDRLPRRWADACNKMDELWVPSGFHRDTFARSGVDARKLHVAPAVVDPGEFDPDRVVPLEIPGAEAFTFLSVLDWTHRQGWAILVEAYLQAFQRTDPVRLVLHGTFNAAERTTPDQQLKKHVRELGYRTEEIPRIQWLDSTIWDDQLPSLYRVASAFVLPSLGAGWALPVLEAMAMGLPVICTRRSGSPDFVNDENSYLIDVERLERADAQQPDEGSLDNADQHWARPSVEHTAALMREVYDNHQKARERGRRARQDIEAHWTPQQATAWIARRLAKPVTHGKQTCVRSRPERPSAPADFAAADGEMQQAAAVSSDQVERATQPVLLWHAPLFDSSGYADESRQFVLGLDAIGARLRVIPLHGNLRAASLPDEQRAVLDRLARASQTAQRRHTVSVYHVFPHFFQRVAGAGHHVGRTMFETDRLPPDWVDACNCMDEIWVPSEFNLRTFASAGVSPEKLVVLPGAIDAERFCPDGPRWKIEMEPKFTFLSILDWGLRKGWDVLLRAFLANFSVDEARLVLKVGGRTSIEIHSRIKAFMAELGREPEIPPNLLLLNADLPASRLPRLYRAADAFVLPSRGEGWGRPIMEAMACGLPAIATGWSGQTAFMKADNSYLIDYQEVEVAEAAWQEVSYFRGHRWAEPSWEHLGTLMRQVFEHPQEARHKGELASRQIRSLYNQQRVARQVWQHVRRLCRRRSTVITADALPQKRASTTRAVPMPRVLWEGDQLRQHSMAIVNRELCQALIRKGVSLSLVTRGLESAELAREKRYQALVERRGARIGPIDVHIRHLWPPDFDPPLEGRLVIIQPWEYSSVPAAWIRPLCEYADELWVPTHFVRDAFIRSGVPADRISVVPNGVDIERFHPGSPPVTLRTERQFRFLFVGGTIFRKGIDLLLRAYLGEFRSSDDVCLVVKDMGAKSFYLGLTAQEFIPQCQKLPHAPEILYIEDELDDAIMPRLYTACHCLVHPYRGEGFGMPITEAMACGLPVIVTGHGAALDYCDETCGYLIPATEVALNKKCIGDLETVDYLRTALPDVPELGRLMRHVFENYEEAQAKGRKAEQRIVSEYGWDRVGEIALERINTVSQRQIRRPEVRIPSPRGRRTGDE